MARIRVHEWIFQEFAEPEDQQTRQSRSSARLRARFILAENKRNKRNKRKRLPRSLAVPRGLAPADREFSRQKVFTGVGQEKAVKRHSKLPMRQFAYLSSGLSKALELDGGREWVGSGVGWQARRVLRFANRKIQLSTWLRRVPTTIPIFGSLCLRLAYTRRYVAIAWTDPRVGIDYLHSQYNENEDSTL